MSRLVPLLSIFSWLQVRSVLRAAFKDVIIDLWEDMLGKNGAGHPKKAQVQKIQSAERTPKTS